MRSLFCSAGFAALILLTGCKSDTPTAPTPTSTIALSGNMAFGNITVGTAATATLTIGNTGTGELTITSVTYPAGFTGSFASGTVAPNGSQAVTVTFTPTAAQSYSGNITVTGNQASGTNTIAASGTGVALATFTLSGLVTETPPTTSTVLPGVVVTFVDGANQGRTATTGADGRYQITGVVNGGYTVSAVRSGYTSVALPVGINGNTTLDFRLEPTAPRTSFGPGNIACRRTFRLGVTTAIPQMAVISRVSAASAARHRRRSSTRPCNSTPASGLSICSRPMPASSPTRTAASGSPRRGAAC